MPTISIRAPVESREPGTVDLGTEHEKTRRPGLPVSSRFNRPARQRTGTEDGFLGSKPPTRPGPGEEGYFFSSSSIFEATRMLRSPSFLTMPRATTFFGPPQMFLWKALLTSFFSRM